MLCDGDGFHRSPLPINCNPSSAPRSNKVGISGTLEVFLAQCLWHAGLIFPSISAWCIYMKHCESITHNGPLWPTALRSCPQSQWGAVKLPLLCSVCFIEQYWNHSEVSYLQKLCWVSHGLLKRGPELIQRAISHRSANFHWQKEVIILCTTSAIARSGRVVIETFYWCLAAGPLVNASYKGCGAGNGTSLKCPKCPLSQQAAIWLLHLYTLK